jgi:hypothetical protein
MFISLLLSLRRPALLLGVLLAAAVASHAQAPGNGGSTGGPPQPEPTAVPLDGGASLLLASGVAFGLKKIRDRRRAG